MCADNLALNQPAVQSSTYAGGVPSRAVDGDTSTSVCTQTAAENDPWWRVDLGTFYPVREVVIVSRDAINGFEIKIGRLCFFSKKNHLPAAHQPQGNTRPCSYQGSYQMCDRVHLASNNSPLKSKKLKTGHVNLRPVYFCDICTLFLIKILNATLIDKFPS